MHQDTAEIYPRYDKVITTHQSHRLSIEEVHQDTAEIYPRYDKAITTHQSHRLSIEDIHQESFASFVWASIRHEPDRQGGERMQGGVCVRMRTDPRMHAHAPIGVGRTQGEAEAGEGKREKGGAWSVHI